MSLRSKQRNKSRGSHTEIRDRYWSWGFARFHWAGNGSVSRERRKGCRRVHSTHSFRFGNISFSSGIVPWRSHPGTNTLNRNPLRESKQQRLEWATSGGKRSEGRLNKCWEKQWTNEGAVWLLLILSGITGMNQLYWLLLSILDWSWVFGWFFCCCCSFNDWCLIIIVHYLSNKESRI